MSQAGMADVLHPWRVPLNRAIAVLGILLIGARIDYKQGITVGLLACVVLLPVWWRHAWRIRGYRWVLGCATAALVSGIWLTRFASSDHQTNQTITIRNSLVFASLPIFVGFLIWAAKHLSPQALALWFGVSLLLGFSSGGAYASNPWKFGFATPVTIIVLALAWWTGWRVIQAGAALLVGAVSAFGDARSGFATLFLVAIVILWEGRSVSGTRRTAGIRTVGFLAGLGLGGYWLIQSLILDGALGEATRARTEAQIEQSGSLVIGGRPEIGAFQALFSHHPLGFGSGTILRNDDILVAKEGMAALGYQPNNGYVEVYMFGGQIELHSVIGDMWAWAGISGLLLAVCLVVVIGPGTARTIGASTSSALMLFLAFRFFWDLCFSPFVSSSMNLYLVLGLGLGGAWERGAGPPGRTADLGVESAETVRV
ncbi:hypothetical protein BH11ACT1_BH11ACT1_12770 [soil metagenome]